MLAGAEKLPLCWWLLPEVEATSAAEAAEFAAAAAAAAAAEELPP